MINRPKGKQKLNLLQKCVTGALGISLLASIHSFISRQQVQETQKDIKVIKTHYHPNLSEARENPFLRQDYLEEIANSIGIEHTFELRYLHSDEDFENYLMANFPVEEHRNFIRKNVAGAMSTIPVTIDADGKYILRATNPSTVNSVILVFPAVFNADSVTSDEDIVMNLKHEKEHARQNHTGDIRLAGMSIKMQDLIDAEFKCPDADIKKTFIASMCMEYGCWHIQSQGGGIENRFGSYFSMIEINYSLAEELEDYPNKGDGGYRLLEKIVAHTKSMDEKNRQELYRLHKQLEQKGIRFGGFK